MSYRTAEFKNLDTEFAYEAQNILDSSDSSIESLENLLDKYNSIVSYAEINWDRKKRSTKEHIKSVLEADRITIQRCFEKLNLSLTLPGNILSTIHYIPTKNPVTPKPSKSIHSQTEQIVGSTNYTQTEGIPNANNSTQTVQTMDTFLKLCGSQINKTFDGDPLQLKAFVDSANLLKSVADDKADTLKLFILSRLTGKARECVRKEPKSVDEIIEDLEEYIKPDNSKIVEGRLLGLRCSQGKMQEFSEQAEQLAEALQRTLIIEGISQEKAKEMTIDRTIDLCRQSARTELVKGIIASTTFTSPKDVLAKFIIENTKEKSEKQILSMRQQGARSNNFSQKFPNNFSNQFQNRNAYNHRRGQQRNFNNNNRGYANSNQYRNFRGNNRNFQQNQRGRGNFRNYNNNNNERYVRMVSENYHGPPNGRAETETAQPNQPTIMRLTQNNN